MTRQCGVSLLEMMVVVAILGIVAVVAVPSLFSGDSKKLDIASEQVVDALRFARTESMRTTIQHGVIFDNTSHSVKVYQLISGTPTYDIYHPVDRKIFSLNLKTDASTQGVELQSYSISYQDLAGNQQQLEFNVHGSPTLASSGVDYMLNPDAAITLSYDGQTRIINVAAMTGRVSVQ